MRTLSNTLIVLAAVAILAVVGTLMTSRTANIEGGGLTVTIGAPLPVPVTGNVGIAGALSVSVVSSDAYFDQHIVTRDPWPITITETAASSSSTSASDITVAPGEQAWSDVARQALRRLLRS